MCEVGSPAEKKAMYSHGNGGAAHRPVSACLVATIISFNFESFRM